MGVEITFTADVGALTGYLDGMRGQMREAIRRGVVEQTGALRRYIKQEKLSGQVLKTRTGNLRNAVFDRVDDQGAVIVGTVSVDPSAQKYARAHEFGAHIPERVPVNAKALRWYLNGAPVFAMRARAFDLPVRSFMRSSLTEMSGSILAALREKLNEQMSEAVSGS